MKVVHSETSLLFLIRAIVVSLVIALAMGSCKSKDPEKVCKTRLAKVENHAKKLSKDNSKLRRKLKKLKKKKRSPIRRIGDRQLVDSKSDSVTLQQLQSLGYMDGTYDPRSDRSGVFFHDEKRAYQGYNLYTSRKTSNAILMDMQGATLHEWSKEGMAPWQYAHLLPGGDLLVVVRNRSLHRIDIDSNIVWSVEGEFHHDLSVLGNQIAALSRRATKKSEVHPTAETLEDTIEFLTLDGQQRRSLSIYDALARSQYSFLLPSIAHHEVPKTKDGKHHPLDIFHTNHVEIFDGKLANLNPLFERGNMLISIRNINTIAILDGDNGNLVWLWGPSNLTFQHHPTLLENGNILLFDNGKDKSQVIELDIDTNQIVWRYAHKKFFSKYRGSNQRLPNGNTLVTESDTGYVFETTPAGDLVWKFANPNINKKGEREAIWRMERFAPSAITFLN